MFAASAAILTDDAVEPRRCLIEIDPSCKRDTWLAREAVQAIIFDKAATECFVEKRSITNLAIYLFDFNDVVGVIAHP